MRLDGPRVQQMVEATNLLKLFFHGGCQFDGSWSRLRLGDRVRKARVKAGVLRYWSCTATKKSRSNIYNFIHHNTMAVSYTHLTLPTKRIV